MLWSADENGSRGENDSKIHTYYMQMLGMHFKDSSAEINKTVEKQRTISSGCFPGKSSAIWKRA